MKRIFILLISICILSGCVSLQKVSEPEKIIPEQRKAEFEDHYVQQNKYPFVH